MTLVSAVLGHIVTTKGDRLPGDIAFGVPFSSIKSGLAAFDTIPTAGFWQVVAFIGLIELGYGYQQVSSPYMEGLISAPLLWNFMFGSSCEKCSIAFSHA